MVAPKRTYIRDSDGKFCRKTGGNSAAVRRRRNSKEGTRRRGGGTSSNSRRQEDTAAIKRRPLTRATIVRIAVVASSSKPHRGGKDGEDVSDVEIHEDNREDPTIIILDSDDSYSIKVENESKGKAKAGGPTTVQDKVHKQTKGKGKVGGSTTEQNKSQAFKLDQVRWKCEGIREQVEELGIKVESLDEKFKTAIYDMGKYFEGRLQELRQDSSDDDSDSDKTPMGWKLRK